MNYLGKLLLPLALLFGARDLVGQVITGRVVDADTKQGLEFVNVAFYSLPDSLLVGGGVSDLSGNYKIDLKGHKEGFLKASYVGYETATWQLKDKLTLNLRPQSRGLKEVVVKGHRKLYENNHGSIKANVQGTVLARQLNVTNLLGKLPGMTVENGSVSSFIGGTPVIYINGRKVQDTDELEQLEVSNIKSVELITNPGAEYDATAESVIKIETITLLEGLSMQVEARTSRGNRWNEGGAVKANFRTGKLTISGSAEVDNRRSYSESTSEYWADGQGNENGYTWYFEDKNTSEERHLFGRFSLGAEYQLDKDKVLGLKYRGRLFNTHTQPTGSILLDLLPVEGNVAPTGSRGSYLSVMNNEMTGQRHRLSLFFNGTLSPKLKLETYADYSLNLSDRTQRSEESAAGSASELIRPESHATGHFVALEPRLIYSFSRGQNLTVGFSGSYVNSRSRSEYRGADGVALSRGFQTTRESENSEGKLGLFSSYSLTLGKFNFKAGLRFETSSFRYQNRVTHSDTTRYLYSLSPNASVSYTTGGLSQTLRYSFRTRSPRFEQLSDVVSYQNRFLLSEGNPELENAYAHSFSYTLGYDWLFLMVNYDYTKDVVTDLYRVEVQPNAQGDVVPMLVTKPMNVNSSHFVHAMLNLRKNWDYYSPSLALGIGAGRFDASNLKEVGEVSNKTFYFANFDNDFTLDNNWYLNARFSYRTAWMRNSYLQSGATYSLDLSATKGFWDNKLQVRLFLEGLLYREKQESWARLEQLRIESSSLSNRRRLGLEVQWRFNNYKQRRESEGAASSELERL